MQAELDGQRLTTRMDDPEGVGPTAVDEIEITGPPDMLQPSFIHGIKRMPCAFTPA